jgi:ribosomal protein L30/L7E
MQKFKEDANNTQQIIELLKVVIIDLIGGYSSHNTKLRVLSEQVFKELFELLAKLKAVPNLF